jgi:hypothetical protein
MNWFDVLCAVTVPSIVIGSLIFVYTRAIAGGF